MIRYFEHSQVYHPARLLMATGAELGRPFEDVFFGGGDGVRLHGWFFPAEAASPRAGQVALYCHGNGGNISHRLQACAAWLETGVGVFIFDYQGYGRSQGRPSEEGTYQDSQAAYRWLRAKGFEPSSIVAMGESLGGGVACELALREPVAGLVLQSTFTSIPELGAELFPWLPVRWFSSIHYATRAKLPRIKTPVLVMHSRADRLVGFHHAQRNFEAAGQPKLFWEIEGGHNEPLTNRARFIAGLEAFLRMNP